MKIMFNNNVSTKTEISKFIDLGVGTFTAEMEDPFEFHRFMTAIMSKVYHYDRENPEEDTECYYILLNLMDEVVLPWVAGTKENLPELLEEMAAGLKGVADMTDFEKVNKMLSKVMVVEGNDQKKSVFGTLAGDLEKFTTGLKGLMILCEAMTDYLMEENNKASQLN